MLDSRFNNSPDMSIILDVGLDCERLGILVRCTVRVHVLYMYNGSPKALIEHHTLCYCRRLALRIKAEIFLS